MRRKTRLKWRKLESKVVSEPVGCMNSVVRVVLDPLALSYLVQDVNGKNVLSAGNASNLRNLKAAAKKELHRLGAAFYDEIRNTKIRRKK